jgi:hypothetical protein
MRTVWNQILVKNRASKIRKFSPGKTPRAFFIQKISGQFNELRLEGFPSSE